MPLCLEVAVFSGPAALKAQSLGANRIELNAKGSYDEGGLTPLAEDLTMIANKATIPVRVMIRPRGPPAEGSDFVYSEDEFEAMRSAIAELKGLNVMNPLRGDGFVFGLLQSKPATEKKPEVLTIDEERCRALIEAAKPLGCVFHRAFDPIAATDGWAHGIDTLIRCGFEGVLTAGGAKHYSNNIDRLDQICFRAVGKIQVIVGGGVRQDNVAAPASKFAAHGNNIVWMHSAALKKSDDPDIPAEDLDSDELVTLLAKLAVAQAD